MAALAWKNVKKKKKIKTTLSFDMFHFYLALSLDKMPLHENVGSLQAPEEAANKTY